ncbi:HD-GYP domain-containing protein [Candidatus Thiodiazotropha sp. CDECU1]|uniref:HD-GYP domain-containing protein n=1 Tax=Candidatus Thiodiazotropha sp. CDECU1 TaxID=3065865 RepID=UPI00292F040C|nr:HD-GYP domain-containing protein [Candidatus Thiodiazotropha sp. CDECU1]
MIEADHIHDLNRRVSLLEEHIGFKLEPILHYALRARDNYTLEHSNRVVTLSEVIGKHLNLQKREMEVLSLAASFHDIGKIGIPDNILLKPGTLTREEYEGIKVHSAIGANMLRTLANPLLDEVAVGVLHHHEQWDGKGYPDGLKGEDIPIVSRIIAVVDAYDAMTTTRSYRREMSKIEALKMIESESGKQFCPKAVEVVLDICRSGKFSWFK